MKSEQCEYCNRDYESVSNQVLRTDDNHKICLYCYHDVFEILFKGTFTHLEAKKALKFLNTFNEELNKYLAMFRKYGIYYNENTHKVLSNVIKLEEELSLSLFNKTRTALVLHKKEHLDLLNIIMKDTSNILPKIYKVLSTEELVNTKFDITNKDTRDLEDIAKLKGMYINII